MSDRAILGFKRHPRFGRPDRNPYECDSDRMASTFFRSVRSLELTTPRLPGLALAALLLRVWMVWFFVAPRCRSARSPIKPSWVDRAAHSVLHPVKAGVVATHLVLDRGSEGWRCSVDRLTGLSIFSSPKGTLAGASPQIHSAERVLEEQALEQDHRSAKDALEARASPRGRAAARLQAESDGGQDVQRRRGCRALDLNRRRFPQRRVQPTACTTCVWKESTSPG